MTEPIAGHITSCFCTRCGGPTPCIDCALEERKRLGLVGKEPDDGVVDELALDPQVKAIARAIREEGFTYYDKTRKCVVHQPPWSDVEYQKRAGIVTEPLELVPVRVVTRRDHVSQSGR